MLGPPMPYTTGRMHPAVLVRKDLEILNAGPPLWTSGGGESRAGCQVLAQVPGMPHPLACYSVHLPSRSAAVQLVQAQQLASVVAQCGEIAVIGGDFQLPGARGRNYR